MPTVLEFAFLFVPTIRESLKQLTETGFVYYISPHSYYEVPESTKIPFLAINTLPSLLGDEQRGSKDDEGLARQLWKTSSPADRS